jgi:hypothetical protein
MMGDFLRFSFGGKDGLKAYLKYFGLCLGVLFLIHMIALFIGLTNVNYRDGWKNIYESVGAAAAGIVFGKVFYNIIKISLYNGTSRASLLAGTGVVAPAFGAISSLIIEAVYLITNGIFRLAGMRLDCIVMCDDRYAFAGGEQLSYRGMNDLIAHDPRFIVFSISEIFLLVMLGYTAVIVFLAVKQRTNLFGALAASLVTAYCYDTLFIDYDSVSLSGMMMSELNENMRYIVEILYPDPMAPNQYGSCIGAVNDFISATLIIFLIGYFIYALFMIKAPAAGKKKGAL